MSKRVHVDRWPDMGRAGAHRPRSLLPEELRPRIEISMSPDLTSGWNMPLTRHYIIRSASAYHHDRIRLCRILHRYDFGLYDLGFSQARWLSGCSQSLFSGIRKDSLIKLTTSTSSPSLAKTLRSVMDLG